MRQNSRAASIEALKIVQKERGWVPDGAVYAIGELPLATAITLNYTAPLFIPLAALLWVGEPFSHLLWWPIGIGFAGIALILKPGLSLFTPVALLGLAAGIFKPLIAGTVRVTTDPTNKTLGFGIFYAMVNVGGSFGPIVMGHLRAISWDYAYLAAAAAIGTSQDPMRGSARDSSGGATTRNHTATSSGSDTSSAFEEAPAKRRKTAARPASAATASSRGSAPTGRSGTSAPAGSPRTRR